MTTLLVTRWSTYLVSFIALCSNHEPCWCSSSRSPWLSFWMLSATNPPILAVSNSSECLILFGCIPAGAPTPLLVHPSRPQALSSTGLYLPTPPGFNRNSKQCKGFVNQYTIHFEVLAHLFSSDRAKVTVMCYLSWHWHGHHLSVMSSLQKNYWPHSRQSLKNLVRTFLLLPPCSIYVKKNPKFGQTTALLPAHWTSTSATFYSSRCSMTFRAILRLCRCF